MLSGGELRRLSLAIVVASGANVLILDEPTNHLDVESREALEDALRSYDGALILVSHDRALLDAVGTRTIALEDGKLSSYPGGWADYMRVRAERRAKKAAEASAAAVAPRPGTVAAAPARAPSRRIQEHQAPDRELERAIEAAERASRGSRTSWPILTPGRRPPLGPVHRAPRGREAEGRGSLRAAHRADLMNFPDGFLWGTATAGFQTEAGARPGDSDHRSDWWEWVRDPADIAWAGCRAICPRRGREAGRCITAMPSSRIGWARTRTG